MRTQEQRDADLADIISRCGPTKECSLCHIVKPRAGFATVGPGGHNVNPWSQAICRRCQSTRTVERRKVFARNKHMPQYAKLRARSKNNQKTYMAKLRARLQAEEKENEENPLSKKLFG